MTKGTGTATQPKAAPRATFESLMAKKSRHLEFNALIDKQEESFRFVAVKWTEYDALVTAHPPTAEQRVAGAIYNSETFAPALLARVCVEPQIDEDGWAQILGTGAWGRGEIGTLFWRAMDICSYEVPITPIVAD